MCVWGGDTATTMTKACENVTFLFYYFPLFFPFFPITTRNLLYDEEKACLPHRERCTRTHNPHYFQ